MVLSIQTHVYITASLNTILSNQVLRCLTAKVARAQGIESVGSISKGSGTGSGSSMDTNARLSANLHRAYTAYKTQGKTPLNTGGM